MNINNRVGIHSNHSYVILWICVRVNGVMDKMPPLLLISSISNFSIVEKSIINNEELLLLPWVLEPLCSLISGPSLRWLMYSSPFSILLQLLSSFFVLVFFLLSWSHALLAFPYTMLETLTLHCCHCLFECNDYIPVRQIWCTVYIYACKRWLKSHYLMNQNLPSFSCLKNTYIICSHYFNRC